MLNNGLREQAKTILPHLETRFSVLDLFVSIFASLLSLDYTFMNTYSIIYYCSIIR